MIPASRCRSRSVDSARLRKYATDAKPVRAVQTPRKVTFGAPSKRPPPRPMSNGLWNPLPVQSLKHPLFQSQHCADSERISRDRKRLKLGALTINDVGKCKSFGNQKTESHRVFGVPRNVLKEFRLQTTPSTVVRESTLRIQKLLSVNLSSQDNRHVIVGPPGCGKSHLLLQAVSLAQSSSANSPAWIVLSFPRCGNLINGSTAYVYDARTELFAQNAFASETLLRLWNANEEALWQLKTSQEWVFAGLDSGTGRAGEAGKTVGGGTLKKGSDMKTLLEMGCSRDSGLGAVVLEAVLAELGSQSAHPVLLAIDELEALFCRTTYKTTAFEDIMTWHLSMPRMLLDYLSGRKTFNNGIVLGATSSHYAAQAPPHLHMLLAGSSDSQPSTKPLDPYAKPLAEVETFSRNLKPIQIGPLDIREAMGVFDLWREERVLGLASASSPSTEHAVEKLELKIMEKSAAGAGGSAGDERFLGTYAESGGNAREMVWRGLLSSLAG